MCSKYLTNLTGSDVTQQHLSLTFTSRVTLRSSPICIDGKGICYIAKEVGEGKMTRGSPKNVIAFLSVSCRGVQKHCKPQSYLSGTHAKPQASFGGY